jgi:hypothetical protein
MFTIIDKDRFSPSASGLYGPNGGYYRLGGRGNMKCTQNPTPAELRAGIYKPRLTLTKRFNKYGGYDIPLKIEFSAPKLLFGNNFDELVDADFEPVISVLSSKLKEMGVYVFEQNLRSAPVSAVHFGKNIALTDYTTPYTYISQLKQVNFNAILDTSQTDYFNGGSGIKAHANSHEVAFYDKVQDLKKAKISPKRAYERDSQLQLGLFETITNKKPFEVLRMEVRLGKRQKIRQIFKQCNLNLEPTFENVFKLSVAQKVLTNYLNQIEQAYPPLLRYNQREPEKFLTDFMLANPKKRFDTALKYTSLRILLEKIGAQALRQLLGRHRQQVWYSLQQEMKKLAVPATRDVFHLLLKQVQQYEPLRLVDFQS